MIIALTAIILALCNDASSSNILDFSGTSHSCELGDAIQNGHVRCLCKQDNVYECNLKELPDLNNSQEGDDSRLSCQANKIYVHDMTTCICNQNGTWPHKACGELFNSLPVQSVVKTTCQPDGYVLLDCNVCRCDSEGNIDKDRCTRNKCDDDKRLESLRRSGKPRNVYGNCEAKNWYSLAPCQFCYCINENKLVCNTGNYFDKQLSLGTYNLSVCGKELIREAIELIPDNGKLLRQGESDAKNKVTSYNATTPQNDVKSREEHGLSIMDDNHETEKQPILETFPSNNNVNQEVNAQPEKEDSESAENNEHQAAAGEFGGLTIIESTQIPLLDQEDYQLYSNKESKESTEKVDKNYYEPEANAEESVTEKELHAGLGIPWSLAGEPELFRKVTKKPVKKRKKPLRSLNGLWQNTFPNVLSKMFNMALRRQSTLTIHSNAECVPGEVKAVKCNTCFCLKNNNLICTDKKCE